MKEMNKRKSLFLCWLFVGMLFPAMAQVPTPGEQTHARILLLNGRAHIGNGEVIEKSAVAITNGKITLVRSVLLVDVKEKDYDTIIDVSGQDIYPGFIAPNSTLGLQEIGAVRASRDQQEVGTFNPHIRSIIAYNTDSRIIPTIRTNGVLVGQICPRGGIVSGTSSVVHFDAWNWEDAIYKEDDAIHLNWPGMFRKSGWWTGHPSVKKNDKYHEQVKAIHDFFARAKAYSNQKESTEKDLRLEAMRTVISGKKKVFVHADFVKEINDVILFKRTFDLEGLVLIGGYDSPFVLKDLKDHNISVVLRRVHALPRNDEDDVDLPYKLPKLLSDAGILFCFNNAGDMEQMGTRNLPFYAGTAVAYGLEYEKAVAALTGNAAKILGIDDKIGTLEKGKDATLFVSKGDALDMRTNQLTLALVQGRFMRLTNHQEELYLKYKAKYGLE